MAKKASKGSGTGKKSAKAKSGKREASGGNAVAKRAAKSPGASDAIKKLLESPLVADLLAVGATAALAAIAQHGFGKGEGKGKGTSKAVKEAGKTAAAAMGRRLGELMKLVDEAVYRAKADGRNRWAVAPPPPRKKSA